MFWLTPQIWVVLIAWANHHCDWRIICQTLSHFSRSALPWFSCYLCICSYSFSAGDSAICHLPPVFHHMLMNITTHVFHSNNFMLHFGFLFPRSHIKTCLKWYNDTLLFYVALWTIQFRSVHRLVKHEKEV